MPPSQKTLTRMPHVAGPQAQILQLEKVKYHIDVALTMLLTHEWTEQTHLSFSLSPPDLLQRPSPMEHLPSAAKKLALPLHPS